MGMEELDIERLKKFMAQADENGGVIAPPTYFTQVPDMFSRRTDLTLQEKMVFIYLWGYGSNKQYAFPSQVRMLKELGISKPTLISILRSLEKKGGLYIVHQYKGNSKEKTVNLYYICAINPVDGAFVEGYFDAVRMLYPDKIRKIG